jgi:hypothetical protein
MKNEKEIKQLEKKYRTRAIITRGLYTFYPLFEVHSRAGYSGTRTVKELENKI